MTPTFSGELQFRCYSDSSRQGPKITFSVFDREALESFIGKEGKRYMAVLVEIGDDEQPRQPEPAKAEELKGGPLAKLAGMWCQSKDFQEWIGVPNQAEARLFILEECGIDSRAELDHNHLAADIFHRSIREPYSKWLTVIGKSACTT
jgi:hypothetical protein